MKQACLNWKKITAIITVAASIGGGAVWAGGVFIEHGKYAERINAYEKNAEELKVDIKEIQSYQILMRQDLAVIKEKLGVKDNRRAEK